MPSRVLLVGVSTRAAAESAARAGFDVTAIDAFADRDQHPSVRSLALPQGFHAAAAARVAQSLECDAVAYLSNLENHPNTVGALAARRALWGNPPEVLRRVRDPLLLAETLNGRGFAVPCVQIGPTPDVRVGRTTKRTFQNAATKARRHENTASSSRLRVFVADGGVTNEPGTPRSVDGGRALSGPADGAWLVKPLASGGGQGVRPWRDPAHLPRRCYLQERVDGTPGSVVFVAAGGRAVSLGVSRQLIGEDSFGATQYRYCGSILAAAGDPQFPRDAALATGACVLADTVADAFNLVGVNGVDFIARDGAPYAIEVNPRWSASMELVERAYGISVFGAHAAACADGQLPAFDLARARRAAGAVGKAVVFARRDVTIGETEAWLVDPTVRDVPHPGEHIRAAHPICTVFAEGRNADACHIALVRRAERVYAELARWSSSEL